MNQQKITTAEEYGRATKRLQELQRSGSNANELRDLQAQIDAYKQQNPNASQGQQDDTDDAAQQKR